MKEHRNVLYAVYTSSHEFITPKIKCSSSKNKCRIKSLILCWSLTLEQFKQDVKTSTSLNAFKHNMKQHCFNESKKKES